MPFEIGDSIILGVGIEATRGEAVAPQVYIPSRTPSGIISTIDKKLVEETKATKFESYGSEIVQQKAEGDLEFNLRYESIGYLLLSLLGSVSSAAKASPNQAVYDHTFSVLSNNVQNPTLTLSLQKSIQAYAYPNALVGKLEINIKPDDLVVAKSSFIAKSESEISQLSPSFSSSDRYFRQQDCVVKIASSLSGLDAADPINLKELNLSIENTAKEDEVIGSLNPADILALRMKIEGKLSGNYTSKTNYDVFRGGSYKAMRIEMTRNDITIGSNQHPKLRIDLPKISFEKYDQKRELDDIVSEEINFKAHYSETDAKGIIVVLTNTQTGYVPA
jgi:hypothetical protein